MRKAFVGRMPAALLALLMAIALVVALGAVPAHASDPEGGGLSSVTVPSQLDLAFGTDELTSSLEYEVSNGGEAGIELQAVSIKASGSWKFAAPGSPIADDSKILAMTVKDGEDTLGATTDSSTELEVDAGIGIGAGSSGKILFEVARGKWTGEGTLSEEAFSIG